MSQTTDEGFELAWICIFTADMLEKQKKVQISETV